MNFAVNLVHKIHLNYMKSQEPDKPSQMGAMLTKRYGPLESLGMIAIGFVGLLIYLSFTGNADKKEVQQSESQIAVKGQNGDEYMRQVKKSADAYQAEIRALYSELMAFKDSDRFLQAGFAGDGFPDWKQRAEVLRDSTPPDWEAKATAITVLQLGLKYVFSKGQENEYTRHFHSKIKQYLDKH